MRKSPEPSQPEAKHRFGLLHISDLHEPVEHPTKPPEQNARISLKKAARQRVLGDAFEEALGEVLALGPLDAVCFTGDVADWGLVEEYAQATKLFDRIIRQLNVPKPRFFAVPGNHDVNRTLAQDAWKTLRELAKEDTERLSEWMGGGRRPRAVDETHRDAILARSKAFWDWLCTFREDEVLRASGGPHQRLGYRCQIAGTGFPFPVEIVGLDSAWLAGDNHDDGKLLISSGQIDQLCTNDGMQLDGFRLVLVHHPLSVLIDEHMTRERLGKYTDLVLHGHQHEAIAIASASPDQRLHALAAGCLFEGDKGDRWVNAFQRIDVLLTDAGRPICYDVTFWGWSNQSAGHWHKTGAIYKNAPGGRLRIDVHPRNGPESASSTTKPPCTTAAASCSVPVALTTPLLFEGPRQSPALPVPCFTGRQPQIDNLAELLTSPQEQVVCVVASGLGGIGKTALAQHFVATEAPSLFPDGAAWLDAGELSAEVVRTAARLGYSDSVMPTPEVARSFVCTTACSRQLLLVIDNVPEAPTPEMLRLLPLAGGKSRTLLTSRCQSLHTLLGAPAKRVPLECWDDSTSIQFLSAFSERCRTVPEPELAALAYVVGHLPLGVRLVGVLLERCVSRSPSELLNEIRRRPLESLDKFAVDRGLAQTFLVAFEHLDDLTRQVLLTLAACARSTHNDIVAEVSGHDIDRVNDALDRLRDWSLAEFYPGGPNWSLHDVVRMFARAQSGYERVSAAHWRWTVAHCKRHEHHPERHSEFARGADEVAEQIRSLVDQGKCAVAAPLTSRLFAHFIQVGRIGEAMELTQRVLGGADRNSPTEAILLGYVGTCHGMLGDVCKSIECHKHALRISEQLADVGQQAAALDNMGIAHQRGGELSAAMACHERALALNKQRGDVLGQAASAHNLALCCLKDGNPLRAIEWHSDSLANYERVENQAGVADAHSGIGNCLMALASQGADRPGKGGLIQKLSQNAMEHVRKAIELDKLLGRRDRWANQLNSLGLWHFLLGAYPEAMACYQEALGINRDLGLPEPEVDNRMNMFAVYDASGSISEAVEQLEIVSRLLDRLSSPKVPELKRQVNALREGLSAKG